MADNLTKEQRSKVMSSIKDKNTKPEIIVRKILYRQKFRYRIHDKTIFGKPDISNKSKKIAIFIDGCFWHGCTKCYREPTSNVDFWRNKIKNNKNRRIKVKKELRKEKWNILELWEHEINQNPEKTCGKLMKTILKSAVSS